MESLSNVLFLDIETVPQHPDYEYLDVDSQMLWEKKSKQWRKDATLEEAYERAGIYAEFGKIICISVGSILREILHVKSFYGDDEKELLTQFKKSLIKFSQKCQPQLCAHNGKEFDFPYICRRMLINGIGLPKLLQIQGKKPWEVPFLDTLELWRFGDYKNYTSLDLLCKVFGIPTPKEAIDGSMVSKIYWEENNIKRIVKYCESDVVALTQLYLKMQNMPTLEPQEILIIE